jgi:hypothetical protein
LLTTVSIGGDTTGLTNSDVGSIAGATGAINNVILSATPAQVTVANTAGIYSTCAGANWVVFNGANDFGGVTTNNASFTAGNAVGATGIEFLSASFVGVVPSALAGQTVLPGTLSFSGSSLDYTVAAVPEPETYGMLAAGLLMLGAIARRRKA